MKSFALAAALLLFAGVAFAACPFSTGLLPSALRDSGVFHLPPHAAAARPPVPPPSSAEPTPLDIADAFFLSTYDATRSALLEQELSRWPLILDNGTIYAFFPNGTVLNGGTYSAELYQWIKDVSHIAFSTLLLVDPVIYQNSSADGLFELPADVAQQLTNFSRTVLDGNASLTTCCGFNATQLARQYTIVNTAYRLIDDALTANFINQTRLLEDLRSVGPIVQQNVRDAIVPFIQSLDSIVERVRASMSAVEWANARWLLLGSHMPRRGALNVQYYAWRLNRTLANGWTRGYRIIYAESITNLEDALSLLGTHLVDYTGGGYIFGDPEVMHSDIQMPAVEEFFAALGPYQPGHSPARRAAEHALLLRPWLDRDWWLRE